jgi:uncharacterized integral membrane protein
VARPPLLTRLTEPLRRLARSRSFWLALLVGLLLVLALVLYLVQSAKVAPYTYPLF